MRHEIIDIVDGQARAAQGRLRRLHHHVHGRRIDSLSVADDHHGLVRGHKGCERPPAAAAGDVDQIVARAFGLQLRADKSACAACRRGHHGGPCSIGKKRACRPVGGFDPAREYVGGDDEHRRAAAACIGISKIEGIDEPATGSRHVDAAATKAKAVGDERRRSGQQMIGRRGGEQEKINPVPLDACGGERTHSCGKGKIREGLIIRHIAARRDAGAFFYPPILQVEAPLDFGVGDAAFRHIVAKADDFGSGHAATSSTASLTAL